MLKQFDSSYAGHIDLDNVGYGGTPINDRRYPNDKLATALSKAEEMAKLMDRLGYGTFWMAEHHFQPEGTECIPNVLLMALHLTHITKSLRIGCGFNITPMWHPLRLAEDYAMADILSHGRVVFGVGRGYHTREVESFGTPLIDQAATASCSRSRSRSSSRHSMRKASPTRASTTRCRPRCRIAAIRSRN